MARKPHKYKLLLDEGFHLRQRFPILNRRFDVKHVASDYKKSGLLDPDVYALARKEGRLLVTYNIKDFVKLAQKSTKTGILGISPSLPIKQIDKKLTALLMKSSEKTLFGKLTIISAEVDKV